MKTVRVQRHAGFSSKDYIRQFRAAKHKCSILAIFERGSSLILRVHVFLHLNALLDRLAGLDGLDNVEQLWPQQRVAFDSAVQLSVGHCLERIAYAID